MPGSVLITGGAGFIGSHVGDALLERGYTVRVLDVLSPQVHGDRPSRPDYLHPDIELIRGDVCDPATVRRALEGMDAVFHFAAAVGVGQSMYEVSRYTHVNNGGTAVLLEALLERPVGRLIVASSMSVYGEGAYRSRSNGGVPPLAERTVEQLRSGEWEPRGPGGERLEPVPTPETKPPQLASVYALSKYDQERLCLMIGQAYDVPVVALRFFNVYGPRQALSNPYTGVLAIFAARLLNGRPPRIFEDGLQRRDFVSVYDVAAACIRALEAPAAAGNIFNIGSGVDTTVREVASRLAEVLDRPAIAPVITDTYRVGDIRHCFADISRARDVLGYWPRVSLEAGLAELGSWLEGRIALDRIEQASAELAARGLTV